MKAAVYALATLFALDVVPSCGKRRERPVPMPPPAAEAPAAPPASPPSATPAPAAGPRGLVRGKITFVGTPPPMFPQKRDADPFCSKKPMTEEEIVVAADGALANVLVRVVGAPATPPPAQKAAIVQRDCRYTPRILPVVRGQKVEIKNGDPTLHNVHGYQGTKTDFNEVQVPEAPSLERVFDEDRVLHKLKCDVHQWMTGYIWVQTNDHFAVTGADGTFEIGNLPVGTYQLEAWHERFDVKSAALVVEAGKPATIDFQYTIKDNTQR